MKQSVPDPLSAWVARLADGLPIDPESAGRDIDAALLQRLIQLERLADTMRRSGTKAGQERRGWGHLRIIESLGAGAFGEVFLAFDPILQREVALKLRRTGSDASDADRWIREARRLARVRHPNVLAVHGADVHDGVPGLWSDRITGCTLDEYLQRVAPARPDRIHLVLQLALAVRAVHHAGLVHGDIKPANVMIDRDDGRPVLMDFGSAREMPDGAPDGPDRSGDLTGTPLFMPPERLAGGAATAAGDVYALGVLYAMLGCGRAPFRAGSLEELRAWHASGRMPDLASNSLSHAERRLIQGMLCSDPARRPTITEVIESLEHIREAPRRRRRRLLAGTIIGLLSIALAVSTGAYLRIRTADAEILAVQNLLGEVLAAPRATEQGRNVRVVDVLEQVLPEAERRFASQPLALARVHALVGRTFESLGLPERAEPLLVRAHSQMADHYGADHPRAIELLDPIARVQVRLGRREQAEATWDQLLAIADPDQPSARNSAMYAHIGKAGLRMHENRLAAALQELDRASALHMNDETARAAQSVLAMRALLLQQAGQHDEAARVGRESLELSLRLNGPRHVNTLVARDRVVQIESTRGEWESAERLARENLEVALDWLVTGERRTVMAQLSLSNVLADRGQLAESLALLDAAAAGAREAFRSDETDPLVIEANRAARYAEIGRRPEALDLLEALQRRLASYPGPAGALPWTVGLNRAEVLVWLGRAQPALEQASAIHDQIVAAHGPDHPLARIADSYRAAALLDLGRSGEAIGLLETAFPALVAVMGTDHPQVLLTEAWYAEALARTGAQAEARARLDELWSRAHRSLPDYHYRWPDLEEIAARVREPGAPDSMSRRTP